MIFSSRTHRSWDKLSILIVFSCVALSGGVFGQSLNFSETQKIISADSKDHDHFGHQMALSSDGHRMAVYMRVMRSNTQDRPEQGVYIYRRNETSSWELEQKLFAGDTEDGDSFGSYLAFAGEPGNLMLVVAAPSDDWASGGGRGSLYIFKHAGDTWVEAGKIEGDTGDNRAPWTRGGIAVSHDASTIAFLVEHGVYIYEHNGAEWEKTGNFVPSWPYSGIGYRYANNTMSLSEDGSVLAIGGHYGGHMAYIDGNAVRVVHMFRKTSSGWGHQAPVYNPDDPELQFGKSASLSGDGKTLVASAPFSTDENGNRYSGDVHIYRWEACFVDSGTTTLYSDTRESFCDDSSDLNDDGRWVLSQKLTAPAPAKDSFGSSVRLSSNGEALLIGAAMDETGAYNGGAVYVYLLDTSGYLEAQYVYQGNYIVSDVVDYSVATSPAGTPVSANGETFIMGARRTDASVTGGSSVYIFDR